MTTWMVMTAWVLTALGQQPVLEAQEVLGLLSEQRTQLTTLQATFKQVTMTSDEDTTSTGTLVYVKPKRIIFRYDDPAIDYMLDRHHAYEYDAELEQIMIFDIEGRPEAEAFFLGLESDTAILEKSYTIKALAPKDPERDAVALELLPRPVEDQEPIFAKVTLQLRKNDYLPTRIDIINDENSSVTFTIEDFILNQSLPKKSSHIFAPDLTDVVFNDEVLEAVGEAGAYFPNDARLGLEPIAAIPEESNTVDTPADE